MTRLQILLPVSIMALLNFAAGVCAAAEFQPGTPFDQRMERFHPRGSMLREEKPTTTLIAPSEALTGFDNQPNGYDVQGADFSPIAPELAQLFSFLNSL
jgi:hypothetical protein